jgi:NAD(P)H-hydrate epimerase
MLYATAAEMKEIDRVSIEERGIPGARLMEAAGAAVARAVTGSGPGRKRALVVSGYGNNGGDGFVAARHLLKHGFDVKVFLVGRPRPFSADTEANFKAILGLGLTAQAVYDIATSESRFADLKGCDVLVDALFGIGIRGRLDELYIRVIGRMNALGADVTSADLPSGLDADAGRPCPTAVKASRTVTFTVPKKGFLNPGAARYTGSVIVADIGVPASVVDEILGKSGDGD